MTTFILCACALDHAHPSRRSQEVIGASVIKHTAAIVDLQRMGFTTAICYRKYLIILSLLVGLQLVSCQVHFDCPQLPPLTQPARTVRELRPQDIKVIMALGDSITAGTWYAWLNLANDIEILNTCTANKLEFSMAAIRSWMNSDLCSVFLYT